MSAVLAPPPPRHRSVAPRLLFLRRGRSLLQLNCNDGGLSLVLFGPATSPGRSPVRRPMWAYATAALDAVRLGWCEVSGHVLWLGSASFDLTPREAAQVEAFLAPLGISRSQPEPENRHG